MPEAQKHPDEVFAVYALACGYLDFNRGGKLAFSPEVIWRCPSGIVKFSKDELLITYELSTITKIRVEIPYRIIESILPSTAPTTLTMTLVEPPRLYDVTKPDLATSFAGLQINQGFNALKPTRRRLTELPDGPGDYNRAKHGTLIGQCLVYQLVISPQEFRQKLQSLRQTEILPIYPSVYNFPQGSPTKNPSFNEGMRQFHKGIQQLVTLMKFEILFQVQALVDNAYIPPWTGLDLLKRLHKHSTTSTAAQPRQVSRPYLCLLTCR